MDTNALDEQLADWSECSATIVQRCRKSFRCVLKSAFTMIELMVVIAIISILMAIFLPALKKAQDLARQTFCAGNLKQIGLAAQLYGGDNNYWLPYYGTTWSGVSFWTHSLSTYTNVKYGKMNSVWTCPSTDKHWLSYGWNYQGIGHTPEDPRLGPTRLGSKKDRCIMSADNRFAADATATTEQHHQLETPNATSIHSLIHARGVNLLEVNGSVKWYKMEEVWDLPGNMSPKNVKWWYSGF